MRCTQTLGDRTGLICTLEADHANGCVFVSGHGSEVDDRHGEGGHG